MRAIRKLGYILTGFGVAALIMLSVAFLAGFFVGIPVYSGILYASTRNPFAVLLGLLPFVICLALWRIAVKKQWIRKRLAPEPPTFLN